MRLFDLIPRLGISVAALMLVAASAAAQMVAYDEFDGRTRAGWADPGIGAWGKESGPGEKDGVLGVISGNSWRALAKPIQGATVWYAVTLRMKDPIKGYASVVPASSASTQFSELGFNAAYGQTKGLWTGGTGAVFTPTECTTVQTFLQRYDLAEGTWSAWSAEGDGLSLLAKNGGDTIESTPLIKNAPLHQSTLSHVYLTKGSREVLEIHRLALAGSAREALTPVPPDGPGPAIDEIQPLPNIPPAPGIAAMIAEGSGLRTGERIAFFGDSLTSHGDYIGILGRSLDKHASTRHVTLLNRGINGGKSTDLLDGVKDLYGHTQGPLRDVAAADNATVIVIMIGINDVWHGDKGNPPETYRKALRALATDAAADHRRVVLCTPTIIGEKRDASNALDATLGQYAAIVREVAQAGGWTLCDTRAAVAAHLDARQKEGQEGLILTKDGVHMTVPGDEILADTIAAAIAKALATPDPTTTLRLVPAPQKWSRVGEGVRTLASNLRVVYASDELASHARVLARDLKSLSNLNATADPLGPNPGEIRLRIDPSLASRGPEAYKVAIPSDAGGPIEIAGASARGVAWGCVTLLQLLEGSTLPADVTIEDAPALPFRGVLLDVARQWHSIRTIKQVVELCRLYKVPFLQLHLTDDQSFTFPSLAFPKLPTPDRHYTREQLADLVAFASSRGVTIIPEMEMPGHAGQMVSRMPELFRAHEKHHATVNFANPATVAALATLVGEICDVFPGPYIHIGGDEADLAFVHENPDFKAAFEREGVASAHDLYIKFLGRMNTVVKSRGRQMMAWEGFGPAANGSTVRVPTDIIIQAYETSYFRPDALVAGGYTIINASWKPLYVVNDRNWTPAEIHAWNPWLWQHFIPGMPSFTGIQLPPNAPVLGSLLCAWEQPESIEIQSLRSRVAAMSDRVWMPKRRGSVEDMERRWSHTDRTLDLLLQSVE